MISFVAMAFAAPVAEEAPRHVVIVLAASSTEIAARRETGLSLKGHQANPAITEMVALLNTKGPNQGLDHRTWTVTSRRKSLAVALEEAGWATGHFGIWGLTGTSGGGVPVLPGDPQGPGAQGYGDWAAVTAAYGADPWMGGPTGPAQHRGSASHATIDAALGFLDAHRKQRSLTTVWLPAASEGALDALDAGLRDLKLTDDTLVWTLGSHDGDGLVRWAGHITPSVAAGQASAFDITPTIEGLATLPARQYHGRSLQAWFTDPAAVLPPVVTKAKRPLEAPGLLQPWWLERGYAPLLASLFLEPWLKQDEAERSRLIKERAALPPADAILVAGQSNITRLLASKQLPDALDRAFPKKSLVVVTSARSGTPLRMWARGQPMYDVLLDDWHRNTVGREVATLTLLWKQGGSDIRERTVSTYQTRFEAFVDAIEQDLGHRPNVVIGRLTDSSNKPDLLQLRKIQVATGTGPGRAWVDTDDLNLAPESEDADPHSAADEPKPKKVDRVHIPQKNMDVFAARLAIQAARLLNGEAPAADGRPAGAGSPEQVTP